MMNNCEDHSPSFPSAVLIRDILEITSYVYRSTITTIIIIIIITINCSLVINIRKFTPHVIGFYFWNTIS